MIDRIIKATCAYYEIPISLFHYKIRKREVVQARQIAMLLSKSMTKLSVAKIGQQIGKKDHATVLHACKTINNLIDTDKQIREDIDEIKKKIDGKEQIKMPVDNHISKEEVRETVQKAVINFLIVKLQVLKKIIDDIKTV